MQISNQKTNPIHIPLRFYRDARLMILRNLVSFFKAIVSRFERIGRQNLIDVPIEL